MDNAGAFRTHLAELRCAEVASVHGNRRGTFGAAVAFEGTNAEAVFEGDRGALGKFFRARHHIL